MNEINHILHIAIPVSLYRSFDYLLPEGVSVEQAIPGMRIKVPFGKREVVGILVSVDQTSSLALNQLKHAVQILDSTPLFSDNLLKLIHWTSEYYHHPLGEVFAVALPTLLRQGRSLPDKFLAKKQDPPEQIVTKIILNSHQQQAVTAITNGFEQFQIFLLNGVTGSGKTEVYLQAVAAALQLKKQALILVPEIGLTPQIIARFQERFSEPIAAFHSGLTERERLDAWTRTKLGLARVIIGTRSAVFAPLQNPGIIIVDEEHDLSYKQQEGLRYSARDLAIMRSRLENIPIVLGSATPSLESLQNVEQKRYQCLLLPERTGQAVHPKFGFIDLRNQILDCGLSTQLLNSIKQHLNQDGQVLLFLNRRGFAPVLLCHGCGWVADCKRCDAKMTLHQYPSLLQCHHCGAQRALDQKCPSCQNQNLLPLGLGTQRLEEALGKHFPDVGIIRIDRDNTRRKGTLQSYLQQIHQGQKQILIGTQMLTKGHHFPDVTLVAVLNADNGLFSADFRATERIAQLLIQVAGRAGRAERSGEVLIQTHNPDNPLLRCLLEGGYGAFAEVALAERIAAKLPPFAAFALLRAEATSKNYPHDFLKEVRDAILHLSSGKVEVLGPIASLMERKAGRYRAQLLFNAQNRSALHSVLNQVIGRIDSFVHVRRVRWSLDVDPLELV